ncbi:MAG: hypothetical protein OEU49_07455, partial [Chromatiales bacterium]|nr:hypothetical protein [Chromatiales bacterium]
LQASLKGLRRAVDSADAAMRSVRELADRADDRVGPLVEGLRRPRRSSVTCCSRPPRSWSPWSRRWTKILI